MNGWKSWSFPTGRVHPDLTGSTTVYIWAGNNLGILQEDLEVIAGEQDMRNTLLSCQPTANKQNNGWLLSDIFYLYFFPLKTTMIQVSKGLI